MKKTFEQILKERGVMNEDDTLNKDYEACAEEYASQSKWISIEERLPKEGDWVVEFFESRNGGKSAELMVEHGESISPTFCVQLMADFADDVDMATHKLLMKPTEQLKPPSGYRVVILKTRP